MVEGRRSIGLDASKFSPPLSRAVIKQHLMFGELDREMVAFEREVIEKGFSGPSVSHGKDSSAARIFFINAAGTHAKLWRARHSPSMFISAVSGGREVRYRDIFDDNDKTLLQGKDKWTALSQLLADMYKWSLEEETFRLLGLARSSSESSPAGSVLLRMAELIHNQILIPDVNNLVRHNLAKAEGSIRASSATISGLLKMVPVLVMENGVPEEEIAAISSEVAGNSYRTISMLMGANPSLTGLIPQQFEKVLSHDPDESKHLFQLETADDGSVFINLSQSFVDYIASVSQPELYGELAQKRRRCPAGRVVVNGDILPRRWDRDDIHPFTKDMWDTALETAELLYNNFYPQTTK